METKGVHFILELSGCDPDTINNLDEVRKTLTEAAKKANAEILQVVFHRFTPQGVSGVVVISESHLSVHTWPEFSYAALDIYTCGLNTMPQRACEYIIEKFKAKNVFLTTLSRGEFENGLYKHKLNQKEFHKEEDKIEKLDVVSR